LILICEYILKKISKDCFTNIWVLKLSAIVNESNYNDFTSQLLKGYNMTIIEKISYNTNIILQNLRYLLKNFKSKKNGILTGIFKKIKEKTYEEINTFFRENIMRVSNINESILGPIKNTKPIPNPYIRTKNNKEYSVVIGLEETLIHFKFDNVGEDSGILRFDNLQFTIYARSRRKIYAAMPTVGSPRGFYNSTEPNGGSGDRTRRPHHRRRLAPALWRPPRRSQRGAFCAARGRGATAPLHHLRKSGAMLALGQDAAMC
jgi:hypothetical protein